MATATVAAPAAAQVSWLADRGLVVGARVGSCVKAHAPFGTVTAVRSTDSLTVRWDDARTESVTWTAISPLGYVVEVSATTATAGQWASAATHLERREEWRTVRIGGVRYVVLTSGNSGRVYHVRADAATCTCRWYETRRTTCAHMLSVELAALEDELREQPAPAPLYSPCAGRCGDIVERAGARCGLCAGNLEWEQRKAASAARWQAARQRVAVA